MSSLDDQHLTHHSPAAYGYHTILAVSQWSEHEELREHYRSALRAGLHRKYPITMGREEKWYVHALKRVLTGEMIEFEGELLPETRDVRCSADEATHMLVMVEVLVPAWVEVELATPRAVPL